MRSLLALAILAGLSLPAHAEQRTTRGGEVASPLQATAVPDEATTQKQLFGRLVVSAKAHACFRRAYDTTHLRHHPLQNVRTMMLLVTADPGGGPDALAPSVEVHLDVTFRREDQHFETIGECRSLLPAVSSGASSDAAHCGINCEGGSIDVSLRNADTMLVGLPGPAVIWQAGTEPDDDTGPYHRRFGADDKRFRLDRSALTDCLALVSDPDEQAALRRGE